MPVEIHYDSEKCVIVATWTNPVEHTDFFKAFEAVAPVYEQATSPIPTIYIAFGLTRLPANAISIYLRNPNSPLHHRMAGILVVVADNAFIKAIVETAGRVARNRKVYVAKSLEDAEALIEQRSEAASSS